MDERGTGAINESVAATRERDVAGQGGVTEEKNVRK